MVLLIFLSVIFLHNPYSFTELGDLQNLTMFFVCGIFTS